MSSKFPTMGHPRGPGGKMPCFDFLVNNLRRTITKIGPAMSSAVPTGTEPYPGKNSAINIKSNIQNLQKESLYFQKHFCCLCCQGSTFTNTGCVWVVGRQRGSTLQKACLSFNVCSFCLALRCSYCFRKVRQSANRRVNHHYTSIQKDLHDYLPSVAMKGPLHHHIRTTNCNWTQLGKQNSIL